MNPVGTEPDLHVKLSNLVNGSQSARLDILRSIVAPLPVLRRHAQDFGRHSSPVRPVADQPAVQITIRPYRGGSSHVQELRSFLLRHVGSDLTGAYVHGSVGTDELIAYSDLDALVVVKDEAIRDADRLGLVAHRLNQARRFMLRFDPLQHHGWFAIAESQLGAYPDWFLPVAALREARSLVPDHEHALTLTPLSSSSESRRQFERTVSTLIGRLRAGQHPHDAYGLKVFLSNVMLLPALYLQARDGRGVFKRDSFGIARADFPEEIWSVMDDVSEMRLAWDVPVAGIRRMLLTQVSPLRRLGKWAAPPLTPMLRERLNDRFYARVHALLNAFSQRLENTAFPA